MSRILDLLTQEWTEKRLAAAKAPPVPLAVLEENLIASFLRKALKEATPETDPVELEAHIRRSISEEIWKRAERESHPLARVELGISKCITVCEYEHANGSAPSVIRDHCRVTCEQVLPDLQSLDGSSQSTRLGDLSQLDLWYVAAVSGDAGLASAVATAYRGPSPSIVSTAILRCALTGDTEGEKVLAARLKPGYSVDFPPKFIELPLGVINGDSVQIAEGLRKLSTRFKGKWDAKKHREFYEKRQPRAPGRPHPNGTWEQFMETSKNHIFSLHWVFSWWAIAWLQVARHRGLLEVFEPKNRKSFSEWVPLAMVEPA